MLISTAKGRQLPALACWLVGLAPMPGFSSPGPACRGPWRLVPQSTWSTGLWFAHDEHTPSGRDHSGQPRRRDRSAGPSGTRTPGCASR